MCEGPSAFSDRVRAKQRPPIVDVDTLARALAALASPPAPDRSSHSPPHRITMKLHSYDGVSEPLETFLARFENFSSHYKWKEEDSYFIYGTLLLKQ